MSLTMHYSSFKTPPIPHGPGLFITEPSTLNFIKPKGEGHQEVMVLRKENDRKENDEDY